MCRRYLAKKRGEVKKKTREQLDAEEMEKMQEESRKKLREYRKSFHRLANSTKKPKTMKYSKPTTESVGFKFKTEERFRGRQKTAAGCRPPHASESHPNNFPMTLRSASKTNIQTEVHTHTHTHTHTVTRYVYTSLGFQQKVHRSETIYLSYQDTT